MEDAGPLSDAVLLARAAAEPDLFAVLYDRHVDAVAGFLYRRTGCPQTTLDLTAETFAAAYVHRRRYEAGRGPARAWLIGIARRQLGTFVRRQRVVDKYTRRLGIPREESGADDLERVEAAADFVPTRDAMRAAMAQLSPGVARAVELRVVDELPFADVALALGCSEGAARVRVSRGLSRLADLLEER